MIDFLIGTMDGLIGLWILGHMARQSFACHCPVWRKWTLWLVAMGFIYQSVRHFDPDRFSDNAIFAFVHLTLWIILSIIIWRIFINRRQEA